MALFVRVIRHGEHRSYSWRR